MNEIWMSETCIYCKRAKKLMDNQGFTYEYINAEERNEEFKQKFPDAKTLPQIIFRGEHVGGYDGLLSTFENQNIFIGGSPIG